ncbi:CPBP family intramembrane metalloprotease [Pseudoalteromonas sp. C2R02]|uniref:CPBP family intramembrane glutamic endopeptidase n=1 Tax=Pseudoalteromonas sp. C2R02 TaxID=2841565 RepID=UPI001C097E96|nr:CPBP family intramembrane glutamic endopeptidase [Pseudoalteromonas sp. C2R02]MBU2968264.1 CPBP family intramembrane metalloprotease [Pseudoalteromonas sp. C2R02]
MFYLEQLQHSGIIWLLLAAAIISAFYHSKLSFAVLSLSLLMAFWLEHISIIGGIIICAGLAVAKLQALTQGILKLVLQTAVVLWMIALAAHLLPGFSNLHVLEQVLTGENSIPFSLYLNLDKPLILFALLLLIPDILKQQALHKPLLNIINKKQFMAIITLTILSVYAIAYGFGLLKFEASVPTWLWVFALNNLIITCVVEEAFFRGFIQTKLSNKLNPVLAIVITSCLFGIAHFAGGLAYVLVATIAGVLYGFTYLYTGRLSAAIAVHFILNIGHLLLFTYPMAK